MFVFAYVMPSDYLKDNNSAVKDNAFCIRSQFMATFLNCKLKVSLLSRDVLYYTSLDC